MLRLVALAIVSLFGGWRFDLPTWYLAFGAVGYGIAMVMAWRAEREA